MGHREEIRAYLEGLKYAGKTIIDWGSGAKPAFRYIQHSKCKWVCLDKNPDLVPFYRENRIEYLVKDIEDPILLDKADVCFCMEVLEHVKEPDAVLHNIYYNLNQDGILHLSVPFLYPKHSDEDYWRFTDAGLEVLLERNNFKNIQVTEIELGYLAEATK